MRRRQPPVTARPGGMPPEFRVGKCIEVWDDLELPLTDDGTVRGARVARRYSQGLHAYREASGIELNGYKHGQSVGHGPWSVAFMDLHDQEDRVTERLAAAGLTRTDLPRLRRAAQRWVARYRRPGLLREPA